MIAKMRIIFEPENLNYDLEAINIKSLKSVN